MRVNPFQAPLKSLTEMWEVSALRPKRNSVPGSSFLVMSTESLSTEKREKSVVRESSEVTDRDASAARMSFCCAVSAPPPIARWYSLFGGTLDRVAVIVTTGAASGSGLPSDTIWPSACPNRTSPVACTLFGWGESAKEVLRSNDAPPARGKSVRWNVSKASWPMDRCVPSTSSLPCALSILICAFIFSPEPALTSTRASCPEGKKF